ncbi:MAG: hypothetical protein MUF58_00980 [Arcicella sp.]|jgi:hypothetical protein|nr:hypothetical protein [Arcicella sp.]
MKKIAIFVEGETESDFIRRVLVEIIGEHNIAITTHKMVGGNHKSGIPRTINLRFQSITDKANFEAIIYISGHHENVDSDIREQKNVLLQQGFSKIIGLKDLRREQEGRRFTIDDLPKVEMGSRITERISQPIPTKIIIAAMEIETWFLAETQHYGCIDNRLTKEFVESKNLELGFNPYSDNLMLRLEPKEDLNNLYSLVKKVYSKKESVRMKTINCLDLDHLRNTVGQNISQVRDLFENIDGFVE